MTSITSADWPEDFDQENGCYWNTCVYCKNTFLGHANRVICADCDPQHQYS